MTKRWLALPVAVVLGVSVGCGGSEDSLPSSPGPAADAEVRASGDEDNQIGNDLRAYFVRNCPSAFAFCEGIAAIEVEDSRVAVRTNLQDDARGRAWGGAFCNLVQGSDVADFTPGHELQDLEGETIKVCPARSG